MWNVRMIIISPIPLYTLISSATPLTDSDSFHGMPSISEMRPSLFSGFKKTAVLFDNLFGTTIWLDYNYFYYYGFIERIFSALGLSAETLPFLENTIWHPFMVSSISSENCISYTFQIFSFKIPLFGFLHWFCFTLVLFSCSLGLL